MQLVLWISGIAAPFYAALGNPIPDDLPLYSDFLSGSSDPSSDFDTSASSFDSPAGALDFPDAPPSLPLETDRLAGSPDAPLELVSYSIPSGTPHETLCGTELDFQPYSKRDGDICTSKPSVEPPPLLDLPDVEKLEQPVGSNRDDTLEQFNFQIFPIPGYTRVGDQDNLCPMPKRRLCCLGPLSGNVGNLWNFVNHCRDFGPWPCPAKYDVCCQAFTNFKVSGGDFVPAGIICSILKEDMNGIVWDLVGGTESGPPSIP